MRQIPVHPAASESRPTDSDAVPSAGVVEPSADLLDRALVGWERFLSTFERASDE